MVIITRFIAKVQVHKFYFIVLGFTVLSLVFLIIMCKVLNLPLKCSWYITLSPFKSLTQKTKEVPLFYQ